LTHYRNILYRTANLLPLVVLGGCSTMGGDWADQHGAPLHERTVVEPTLVNHYVIDSPGQTVVGVPQVVLARHSDTLSDLARAYGLGYDELAVANPDVDPWLPGDQTPVLLPTQFVLPDVPREGIVLNIASRRLFYFPQMPEGQPQVVKTYPIGIGRVGWETPLGATTVVAKAVNPHWYVPASVRREHRELGNPLPSVIPPGPDNPLGSRVLKLEMPGYLIHGTNQPYGVGMRVSHGCVRLYPENIEYLYELVDIGEPVRIINEPFLIGELNGEILFEAHQPLEDDVISSDERLEQLFVRFGEVSANELTDADQGQIRTVASIASGVPARIRAYDTDEVFARARLVRNTVEADPNAPTLSEVRKMMDEVMLEDDQS
jgi:L,D-transpeptidase ErfK/SrfK